MVVSLRLQFAVGCGVGSGRFGVPAIFHCGTITSTCSLLILSTSSCETLVRLLVFLLNILDLLLQYYFYQLSWLEALLSWALSFYQVFY
jgi:hypothetical protein